MTDSTQAIFKEASGVDIDYNEAHLLNPTEIRLSLMEALEREDEDFLDQKIASMREHLLDADSSAMRASVGYRAVGFLMIAHDLDSLLGKKPDAKGLAEDLRGYVTDKAAASNLEELVSLAAEMAEAITKVDRLSTGDHYRQEANILQRTTEGNILFYILDRAATSVVVSQSPNQEKLANRLFDATYGTPYPNVRNKGVLDVLDDLFPVLGIDKQMQRLEDIRADAVAFEDSHIDHFPVLKTIGYKSLEELFKEHDEAIRGWLEHLYHGGQAPVAAAPAAAP